MVKLEIACFNPTSALIAATANPPASRIELCTNAAVGGLTPSLEDFNLVKNYPDTKTPIYVMIRPHARDFVYRNEEITQMIKEIDEFGNSGADGFVFGVLNPVGTVDIENCKRLLAAAHGKPCTFHRAFDEIPELQMRAQLEILIDLGFRSVLTSGGKVTALEGKDILKWLVQKSASRIDVIVGGGVRSVNVEQLRDQTQAAWFHSSAVVDDGVVASRQEIERTGAFLAEPDVIWY